MSRPRAGLYSFLYCTSISLFLVQKCIHKKRDLSLPACLAVCAARNDPCLQKDFLLEKCRRDPLKISADLWALFQFYRTIVHIDHCILPDLCPADELFQFVDICPYRRRQCRCSDQKTELYCATAYRLISPPMELPAINVCSRSLRVLRSRSI